MAPKVNCNPQKLANIVTYLQKSRLAHSIKDLEKHLPSVASINGMQVKDYLQALQDENKINVEKIGSGNWYWSFASQEKKVHQKALDDAQDTYDKATAANEHLKLKIAEAKAQRTDEQSFTDCDNGSREDLVAGKARLEAEMEMLVKELATYSDHDPTELQRKATETELLKRDAEQYTDEIYSIEGWFKNILCMDEEALKALRAEVYGDEYDEEENILKELI